MSARTSAASSHWLLPAPDTRGERPARNPPKTPLTPSHERPHRYVSREPDGQMAPIRMKRDNAFCKVTTIVGMDHGKATI